MLFRFCYSEWLIAIGKSAKMARIFRWTTVGMMSLCAGELAEENRRNTCFWINVHFNELVFCSQNPAKILTNSVHKPYRLVRTPTQPSRHLTSCYCIQIWTSNFSVLVLVSEECNSIFTFILQPACDRAAEIRNKNIYV